MHTKDSTMSFFSTVAMHKSPSDSNARMTLNLLDVFDQRKGEARLEEGEEGKEQFSLPKGKICRNANAQSVSQRVERLIQFAVA